MNQAKAPPLAVGMFYFSERDDLRPHGDDQVRVESLFSQA